MHVTFRLTTFVLPLLMIIKTGLSKILNFESNLVSNDEVVSLLMMVDVEVCVFCDLIESSQPLTKHPLFYERVLTRAPLLNRLS